jgi:hypothetical protein
MAIAPFYLTATDHRASTLVAQPCDETRAAPPDRRRQSLNAIYGQFPARQDPGVRRDRTEARDGSEVTTCARGPHVRGRLGDWPQAPRRLGRRERDALGAGFHSTYACPLIAQRVQAVDHRRER